MNCALQELLLLELLLKRLFLRARPAFKRAPA